MKTYVLAWGLLAGSTWSAVAFANCAAPPPVIWSYPSDGVENVPTDAKLLMTGTAPSVEINGKVISRAPNEYAIDIGPLEPNTTYSVTFAESPGSTEPASTIEFRTGEGPGIVEFPTVDRATCEEIIQWQGCFDTGPPDVYKYDVDVPGEEEVFVLSIKLEGEWEPTVLWPRDCGETIRYETYHDAPEVRVHALNYNGDLYEAGVEDLTEEEGSGGCSIGSTKSQKSSGPWALLLGLGGLVATRQISRRARRSR